MKKKILSAVAAAVLSLAIGITYGTVAHQDDNWFSMNLEALSLIENNGAPQCHPIVTYGGVLIINGIICLNYQYPYKCSGPHSAYASESTVDCEW